MWGKTDYIIEGGQEKEQEKVRAWSKKKEGGQERVHEGGQEKEQERVRGMEWKKEGGQERVHEGGQEGREYSREEGKERIEDEERAFGVQAQENVMCNCVQKYWSMFLPPVLMFNIEDCHQNTLTRGFRKASLQIALRTSWTCF